MKGRESALAGDGRIEEYLRPYLINRRALIASLNLAPEELWQ